MYVRVWPYWYGHDQQVIKKSIVTNIIRKQQQHHQESFEGVQFANCNQVNQPDSTIE